MKKPQINSLFATPIYQNNIDRQFTKQELKFVNNQKNKCNKNQGNISTKDTYILNRKELKSIKKFLNTACKDYLEKIISPKNNIELYITQSWLNYTEENHYHHKHRHPNSVVSGVLYIQCKKENDKIKFTNPTSYQQIVPEIEKYNICNSSTWWFPLETGQLIMFPSSTPHEVETKKGNNARVSLAFNTFYKGILGSNINSTELIL